MWGPVELARCCSPGMPSVRVDDEPQVKASRGMSYIPCVLPLIFCGYNGEETYELMKRNMLASSI